MKISWLRQTTRAPCNQPAFRLREVEEGVAHQEACAIPQGLPNGNLCRTGSAAMDQPDRPGQVQACLSRAMVTDGEAPALPALLLPNAPAIMRRCDVAFSGRYSIANG